MKYSLILALSLLSCAASLSAAVSANLVISVPEGTDDPQAPTAVDGVEGGLALAYGGKSFLRFIVKAGNGNVKLNNEAGNSGAPEIKAWGDLLDVLGDGNSLPGSPLSYVPEADEVIIITLNGENSNGGSAGFRANNGTGFGVIGGNPNRLDWRFDQAASEGIRLDVDATALPETHRVVISSITVGNGTPNGVVIPTVTNFAGGAVTGTEIVTLEDQSVLELSSAHELLGGRFGQIWVRQAVQPEAGDLGFCLQGISLDVLPYYGEWANYFLSNEAGDTETKTVLGSINTSLGEWVWSNDLSLWIYINESSVTNNGSWAYLPAESEAALGETSVVENDWLYLQELSQWLYQPASLVGETGSWVYVLGL
ncbi:hypothetical protein G0Q06_03895 [Puniceicoccales bacterium CK1056]|uniref:Uncharacterized protein n=1 Tax=Oceanipulchritudo coccoides TaxID=2706888 RepID=A0A6B2M084_9BACT|nr:hypothetical protein [Oceanipulchritudo coccoides]NDV61584.1 hypothetical protein [Oceanipulchritudo coccoides]